METTTYVIQRCKAKRNKLIWVDAFEHDTEEAALDDYATLVAHLGATLGPYRIVRRTETLIK